MNGQRSSTIEGGAGGAPLSVIAEQHLTKDAAGGLNWQPAAETCSLIQDASF